MTAILRQHKSASAALGGFNLIEQGVAKWCIRKELADSPLSKTPILIVTRTIKEELGDQLPFEVATALYQWLLPPWQSVWWFDPLPVRVSELASIKNSALFKVILRFACSRADVKGLQAVINFNYEDLIEEFLRENDVRCSAILSGEDEIRAGCIPCYHPHGILPFLRHGRLLSTDNQLRKQLIGNFVFAEDDYHTEYSDPHRWSNSTVTSHLQRLPGLFVGFSFEDPNLRRLIDVVHRQFPNTRSYAILPRQGRFGSTSKDSSSLLPVILERFETSALEKIGIDAIWCDSFDEIPQLLLDICATTGEPSQDPQTIAAL